MLCDFSTYPLIINYAYVFLFSLLEGKNTGTRNNTATVRLVQLFEKCSHKLQILFHNRALCKLCNSLSRQIPECTIDETDMYWRHDKYVLFTHKLNEKPMKSQCGAHFKFYSVKCKFYMFS